MGDWINMAQDRAQWQDFVDTVMNLRLQNRWKISWQLNNRQLLKGNLLCGVSEALALYLFACHRNSGLDLCPKPIRRSPLGSRRPQETRPKYRPAPRATSYLYPEKPTNITCEKSEAFVPVRIRLSLLMGSCTMQPSRWFMKFQRNQSSSSSGYNLYIVNHLQD